MQIPAKTVTTNFPYEFRDTNFALKTRRDSEATNRSPETPSDDRCDRGILRFSDRVNFKTDFSQAFAV